MQGTKSIEVFLTSCLFTINLDTNLGLKYKKWLTMSQFSVIVIANINLFFELKFNVRFEGDISYLEIIDVVMFDRFSV